MTPLDRLEWLGAIAKDGGLGPQALQVAVGLVSFVNAKSSEARPGLPNLTEESGTSVSTVKRQLAYLRNAGYLDKRTGGGRGRATVWRLTFPPETGSLSGPVYGTETGSQTGPETGPETGPGVSPQQGRTWGTGVRSARATPAAATPEKFPAPDWIASDIWERWLRHLKQKGRAMTQETCDAQIRQLAKSRTNEAPEATIERSIAGGWLSLRPKEPGNGYETAHDRVERLNAGANAPRDAPRPKGSSTGQTVDAAEWRVRRKPVGT